MQAYKVLHQLMIMYFMVAIMLLLRIMVFVINGDALDNSTSIVSEVKNTKTNSL
jgi:uncharacterized membrane protein